LRAGGFAGRNLVQEHVAEVAAPVEMQGGAARAGAGPVTGLDAHAVDRQPFLVGIDPVARLLDRSHTVSPLTSAGAWLLATINASSAKTPSGRTSSGLISRDSTRSPISWASAPIAVSAPTSPSMSPGAAPR